MNRAFFFLPWLALAACAPADTTISLQGYNQSCATAADCEAVHTGEICGSCTCGNTAINRADLARYNAEFKDKQESCSEPIQFCRCAAPTPLCNQGKCAVP